MICNKWVNWKILINSLSHADLPNVTTSINNIEKKNHLFTSINVTMDEKSFPEFSFLLKHSNLLLVTNIFFIFGSDIFTLLDKMSSKHTNLNKHRCLLCKNYLL